MIALGTFTCLFALAFLLAYANLLDERGKTRRAEETARRLRVERDRLQARVLPRTPLYDQMVDERGEPA